jgi:hypothetical protein
VRQIGNGAAALLLVVGVSGLAGCGGGATTLSTQAGDQLHADIESARAALGRGQDAAALAAVNKFRATVRDLAGRGDLAAVDARVLLTRADRIAAGIGASASASPTPSPVAVTPVAVSPAKGAPPGKAKGKPHGKGPGHD